MGATISALYDSWNTPNIHNVDILEKIGKTSKRINRAIKNIYDGTADQTTANAEIVNITNDTINAAIDQTFTLKEVKNPILKTKLQTNSAVFSTFKAHQQAKLIHAQLTDEKGNKRSFSQFKKRALKISDHQNKNWLKTEYNTALARARTAEQFDRFARTQHLFPNLEWIPSRSANPRDTHREFYGIVKPINDPFWDANYPGNIWNCKCDISQTKKTADKDTPTTEQNTTKGIDQNPAKGQIFTNTHPYFFSGLNKKQTKALEEQGLKIARAQSQKQTEKWIDERFPPNVHEAITVKADNLQTGQMLYRRGSVKNIISHNADPIIKAYPRVLEQNITDWKYLGYKEVGNELAKKKDGSKNKKAGQRKHPGTIIFAYYTATINGKKRVLNMKLTNEYGEVPYVINERVDDIIKRKIPKKYLDQLKTKK